MEDKIKQAIGRISEVMRHGGNMSLEAIATASGISGELLTDAVVKMEELGIIDSETVAGSTLYWSREWWAQRRAAEQATPEAKVEVKGMMFTVPTQRKQVAAYFRDRPGQQLSPKDLKEAMPHISNMGDVLTDLKKAGVLVNLGRGHWVLAGTEPAEEALKPKPEPKPAAVQQQEETVAVPMLPLQANANEKPYWAEEINVGGFLDGSFVIRKAGGRTEMTLSRAQMLRVVGFVNQFLAMEA
ncbi:MAG: hypothetical protein Q4A62_00420 [Eikenella sp.]|nr:hypothetical protein [Eikenella sp.]